MNRHLRHYHWKKVCRYGHAHDRFFALFLLSYLTRVRRAGLEPAFCASLFSSKSCCVFQKHETFFSAQVLPVKLPPYSVIPFGILVHNSSIASCISSRSFSVIAFFQLIFFFPIRIPGSLTVNFQSQISHISEIFRNAFDFPHSVFVRRTLLFAARFAHLEFLHRPLLTGVFLQLRLISLLPIQNSLIEKSAFLPGKPSADFCPFGDNRDLNMCLGICHL